MVYVFIIYFSVALALACVNEAASGEDSISTMAALRDQYAQITDLDESCSARYHLCLHQRREEKEDVSRQREIKRYF